MGETAIDPKALEDAMLKALPSLFPNLLGTTGGPRVDFYDKFQREADEYDRDFTKKYDDDLNTTLIFAGLFSAVTTSFIIDVQQNLQPDYQQLNYAVSGIMLNVSLGLINADTAPAFPQWTGPDAATVHVQAILYSSLATSLLAAFLAVLGKQWLNRYGQTEMRGSTIDRSRHRQRKMNGMVIWRFPLVMECLPLMLQAALLLLGYALSNYLFSINKVVAGVAIGFTAFGVLFYLLIVSAATFSYNCPFQTPLPLIFHLLVRFDDEHKKYLKRTKTWCRGIFSWKKQQRPKPGSAIGLKQIGAPNGNGVDHIVLSMTGPQLDPLFDGEIDLGGYVLDSKCIAWMFDKSTDADVIMAIMRFIPEVVWYQEIKTTPMKRLHDMVLDCFDNSSGHPVVFTKLKTKAYLSAKALLHLAIQRKCARSPSDEAVFNSISDRHKIMGSEDFRGDSDLESTLGIIDRIFGRDHYTSIPWQKFSFTAPHHTWMARILLYRAWYATNNGDPLPDDVKDFVLHSLRSELPPPVTIVRDCLFIVGLILGIGIESHVDDPLATDMSHKVNLQINKIYTKLTETFGNRTPTTNEIDHALEALGLIAPLSERNVAEKSCNLFRIVMQAPVSPAYPQVKKWDAARLTMHGAYKSDKFLPPVGDPQDILAFLAHHFDLATGDDHSQDEPIQDALRALAHTPGPAAVEALRNFDPTQPSFVRGICNVCQDNNPPQLRKAAFFFLPLISDRWFDNPDPVMTPDQMKSFCMDWASAMDQLESTEDVKKTALTVLFGMINSPHWLPYIVADKWALLESFALIPDDSQPLRKCLDNPDLMDAIKNTGNAAATSVWLKILWLKYGELVPGVQKRLETATKAIAQGRRRTDLDGCSTAVESELRKAEQALTRFNTFSQEPAALALKKKIDNLERAKNTLANLKRG